METVKQQITDFINKCEEVRNCKFIMATSKIKDLLKSIVNSAELYELFSTVANNFDYPAEKRKCFVEGNRCRMLLPETVGDRLAFIFCLLVEFDHNEINFNAFLQKYYPKDGSFYSSYHLFCDEVIVSLENIIRDIYSKELQQKDPVKKQIAQEKAEEFAPPASDVRNTALILINAERDVVYSSTLSEDDKDAASEILSGLYSAVSDNDVPLIKALTCGYNYFVLYTGLISERLSELFNVLSALVG